MRRLVLSLLFAASPAVADGAFPNGMQVLVRDAQHIYLGSNFGLVLTEDGGASWRYVCEPYVTGSLSNVALYALAPSSDLLSLSDHLRRSADGGCTWTSAPEPPATTFRDVFAGPGGVFAVTWTGSGSGVWLSHEAARPSPTSSSAPASACSASRASGRPSMPRPPSMIPPTGAAWRPPLSLHRCGRALAARRAPRRAARRGAHPSRGARRSDQALAAREPRVAELGRPLLLQRRGADLHAALAFRPRPDRIRPGRGRHALRGGQAAGSVGDGSFFQIQGPASCVRDACAQDWAYQQSRFGAPRAAKGCGCSGAGGGGSELFLLLIICARSRTRTST